MDVLDHSDDEDEQSRRFGARRLKRRSGAGSHQHLLLMDCVGGNSIDGDGASEDNVPLPDYERLSQYARLPDDDPSDPPTELRRRQQTAAIKQGPPSLPQQKPAAWRLIDYVRSRHRSGGGAGSDGDSKSTDGEDGDEESKDKNKKKRSSWLPDPDRRWPVQGFY